MNASGLPAKAKVPVQNAQAATSSFAAESADDLQWSTASASEHSSDEDIQSHSPSEENDSTGTRDRSDSPRSDEDCGSETVAVNYEIADDGSGMVILPEGFSDTFTVCVRSFVEWMEFLGLSAHSEETLGRFREGERGFRILWLKHLSIFSLVGLNLPKFHLVVHAPDQIRQWGARDVCSAEKFENLHKAFAKDPHANTNKRPKQILAQMVSRLDHKASAVDAAYCIATATATLDLLKGSKPEPAGAATGASPVTALQIPTSHRLAASQLGFPPAAGGATPQAVARGNNRNFPPIILSVRPEQVAIVNRTVRRYVGSTSSTSSSSS